MSRTGRGGGGNAPGGRVIVTCGEALVDFTPARCGEAQGYLPHPGGSPYNVAVGLGRLEAPVAFLGRLSVDAFGRLLRAHLAESGVDLRYVREGPEPSTLAFVHLSDGAEPEFVFYGEGTADRTLHPVDIPAGFPEDVTGLHFGSLSLVLEPVSSTLSGLLHREHGGRVISLDPNVRPALIADPPTYRRRLETWIARADVVKASRADLSWLYPHDPVADAASRWRSMGPALVVVTMGKDGAEGFGAAGAVRAPAPAVRVVDTVGAGDAFTAGLLARLHARRRLTRDGLRRLTTGDVADALRYANRVAALTCARAGADPPRRSEVEG